MKKKPRPERPRTRQRRLAREGDKLAHDRERLFSLSPGGSAGRPLSAVSASVIEARALGVPCPRCRGEHELTEHAAVTFGGNRLREVRLRCRRCGSRRSLFFQIEARLPN